MATNPHAGGLIAELEATKSAALAAIVAVDEMMAKARQGVAPTRAQKEELIKVCERVSLKATHAYVSSL